MGGMAEIFLAKRLGPEHFQKAVVIKKLLPDLAEDDMCRTMFLDEARLAARLNHENIVQIYDLGVANGAYFIVMEYLVGDDLGRVIREHRARGRRIETALAIHIISESAKGLAYAHSLKDADGEALCVVHRDVIRNPDA